MRTLILFGTKLYVYLIELPIILVLYGALKYNSEMTNLVRLYPLIVAAILGIIFVLIYFFNAVIITDARIKQFGVFSSRDSAIIKKDTTLRLTYLKNGNMRVELFAMQNESSLSCLNGESYVPTEANVFRERVIGKNTTARRVLKFFGVEKEHIDALIYSDLEKIETENFTLSTDVFEDKKEIKIKFKKTV